MAKSKKHKRKEVAKPSEPTFSSLLGKLKSATNDVEFETALAKLFEALQKPSDRNATDVQNTFTELSNYFQLCMANNCSLISTKSVTIMADLHYIFGSYTRSLEYFKIGLRFEKPSSCDCCL